MATIDQFEQYTATPEHAAQAVEIARRKLAFINANAPSGTVRSPLRIQTNIAHGLLAQFAVQNVLTHYVTEEVEMYDLVRTDEFRDRDPWDMRLKFGDKWFAVEVRSSYIQAKCENVADVLKCIEEEYNLIASYQTSYKAGEDPKHVFFQVYWPYTQREAEQRFRDQQLAGASCYVVGYASAKKVREEGKITNLGQRDARFKIIPIRSISPCSGLKKPS